MNRVDGIILSIGEDGIAREYDDTYDITIHCASREEQEEAIKALGSKPNWIPCSERLPGKEKTENDYIAEFIKERHPYMLDSFAFSAWKIKHICYELGQTFKQEIKEAWDSAWNGVDELETDGYTVQQRGTVVTCGINKCKHNDDGLCKAESIYLSEDHDCDGGCDDGWDIDEEEEEE